MIEHVTGDAVVLVDEDLTGHEIAAYLPDAAEPTGYRVVPATVTGPGGFRIDGVPEDVEYVLRFAPPGEPAAYFVTSARELDLGHAVAGRPDAVAASAPQPVTLELADLQAWQAGDRLIATSYRTGTECAVPAPAVGAIEVDATFDWAEPACRGAALLDDAAGDRLEVAHVRSAGQVDSLGRLRATERTVDLFETGGVTMAAGAPATISGALVQVSEDQLVRFGFSRTMFDAGHDPRTALVPASARVEVMASAGAERGVVLGPPIAAVTFADWSRDAALTSTLEVPAGDGFDAALPRVHLQSYARRRTLRRPDTTGAAHLDAETRIARWFAPPVPSGPSIGPPTNLTVGGRPGAEGGGLRLTGPGPITVDWITVATASEYELTVLRADDEAGTTRLVPVATLTSAASILDVPAEVFAGGTWFAFRLTVRQNGTLYAEGRLRARTLPSGSAAAVSGLYRIGATCGDGVPGPDEECDPGDADTPACDLDCTIPLCGDGYRNAAANEPCDTIDDSFACDDDCTVPVCGDGHTNPNLEDCDDGNLPDTGNGCSTGCKANNVCGDGVVQGAIEDCDPPGPACGPDCRAL